VASTVSCVVRADAAECIRNARFQEAWSCASQSLVCASGSAVWTTCLASDQMAGKCWCRVAGGVLGLHSWPYLSEHGQTGPRHVLRC
jgi:hypothetical protein